MYNVKELIIFLTIVLSVYFLGNFYIYKRAVQSLSLSGGSIWYFRIAFILIILSFPLGRFLEAQFKGSPVNYVFYFVGSVWMGMMLYLILSILLIDILRMVNHFVHFFPEYVTRDKTQSGRIAFYAVSSFTLIVMFYGFFNARYIQTINVDVELEKLKTEKNPLSIVQISDVHLGKLITQERLFTIAERVNELNPDIVVITGDLVDDSSADLDDIVEPLKSIKTKFGKYFVSGNHDYFGNYEKVKTKVEESGVRILNNEYVVIDSAITLLGLDYLYGRKSNKDNRTIREMLLGSDTSLPVVMLKHVPDALDKTVEAGIDLQLSGHTHHGQLFPFNFITNQVYEISNGLGVYKSLQVYVNRGVGFWGPPARVGIPAEITKINLKSNKKK